MKAKTYLTDILVLLLILVIFPSFAPLHADDQIGPNPNDGTINVAQDDWNDTAFLNNGTLNITPAGSLENLGTFRLEDVADIVLYSHVPPADGLLEAPGIDYPIGPASGMVETFLFYALTVEIAEGLITKGIYPRIG